MTNKVLEEIRTAYRQSQKHLLLLDYDGTLVDFEPLPELAKPGSALLDLLQKLTSDPRNMVVIVSGRSHQPFDAWFDGLPLTIFAEHGALLKRPGQEWETLLEHGGDWKTPIRNLMQTATGRIAGSFIEEKTIGLVWHYRPATNQLLAESTAAQLKTDLDVMATQQDMRITSSKKTVEARLSNVHKGTAANHSLDDSYDFILAAGDDLTDEDLFAALPASAFTIKIGSGATKAKHSLPSPSAFLKLLADLGQA